MSSEQIKIEKRIYIQNTCSTRNDRNLLLSQQKWWWQVQTPKRLPHQTSQSNVFFPEACSTVLVLNHSYKTQRWESMLGTWKSPICSLSSRSQPDGAEPTGLTLCVESCFPDCREIHAAFAIWGLTSLKDIPCSIWVSLLTFPVV